jgi:hypothetical protein
MKKIISVTLVSCLLLFATAFSECGGGRGDVITREGKEKAVELMRNLEIGDEDGLRSMFSQNAVAAEEFDEQIKEFWSFFDGGIVTYTIGGVSGITTPRDGRMALLDVSPSVEYIELACGNMLSLFFQCYVINTDNQNMVGINGLVVRFNGDLYEDADFFIVGEFG